MKAPEFWHFSRPAIAGIADHAATLESQGWDGMSLTDSQNLSPDIYVALTIAAQATERLQLGSGVTNPVTRHPAVTAGAISALQELSGGRAMLGLGRGDSALFNIGRKPAPRAEFEPYVASVQSYLSGKSISLNGYPSALHWLDETQAKVPVDISATGPKVIEIGARHAERVGFAVGSDPSRVRWALDQLLAATPSGREPVSPGLYINICVHDDIATATEMVRAGVGIFAHFSGMRGATPQDVSNADKTVFEAIESGYDRPRHGHADAAHAKALPQDFIERFAIVGPAKQCIARLQELAALGIERFFVIGPRPDQFGAQALAASERFAQEVIPSMRDR